MHGKWLICNKLDMSDADVVLLQHVITGQPAVLVGCTDVSARSRRAARRSAEVPA